MNSVADRVRQIVVEELAVSAYAAADVARLDALGADSQDRLSLTLALETAFDIEIPDRDAVQMQTVGDIVTYIEGKAGTVST